MHVSEPGPPDMTNDSLLQAIAAASKVNALLIASGKLKPSHSTGCHTSSGVKKNNMVVKKFDAEVEINDAPIICRDILTRISTQDMISKKAGVFVNTKGRYLTSEQRLVVDTTRDRPLYLYIQAETEANVQHAVGEINEIILSHGGMINQTRGSTISIEAPIAYDPQPPAVISVTSENQRPSHTAALPSMDVGGHPTIIHSQPNLSQPPPGFINPPSRDTPQNTNLSNSNRSNQVQFIEEKMYLGLEHAPPTFDVRNKVLGTEGSFLQHIHSTSGAVVTLRGRNSGYLDPKTAQESTEPMHIHLKHMSHEGLAHAKQLANDLIKTVQNDYSQFQRELALQPVAAAPAPVLAAQALSVSGPVLPAHQAARVTSVLHGQPTSGGVTGSQLVSSQNGAPAVVGFTQQDQPVFSSSPVMSLAPPPISVMMPAQPQQHTSQLHYSLSRPPTYVQAVPPSHPITSGLIAHQCVGYNSLTSQGIEVVHQAIPMTRPLTSIQPLSSENVTNPPQPVMTVHHQVGLEVPPPGTILISENIHHPVTAPQPNTFTVPPPGYVTSQIQSVDMSQPPPAVPPPQVTLGTVHINPVTPAYSSGPPVHTSIAAAPVYHVSVTAPIFSAPPPVVMTSMAGSESSRVVFVNQATTSSARSDSIPLITAAQSSSIQQQIPSQHTGKPLDAVTYIVQQQQPVEAQIVHIEAPDVTVPPPSADNHITAAASEPSTQHPPIIQQLHVNEYGQPVGPALEVVHVRQPNMIASLPAHTPQSVHIEAHNRSTLQQSNHHINNVPTVNQALPRYPTAVVPSSLANTVMIPNLMDVEIHHPPTHLVQERQPPEILPPIEPPPHLATGDEYHSKRRYDGDNECQHRPPYRGSGRPYSAIAPPSFPAHNHHDTPRYKRPRARHFQAPPPPPPPM